MERKIIRHIPKCEVCESQLVITELVIDMLACAFVLQCECITCGEEQFMILSLEDFIELNIQLSRGK